MSARFLAEFLSAETLCAASEQTRKAGHPVLDAFSPYPVEGLAEKIGDPPTRIRYAMFGGGLLAAASAFALQWYSAAVDYPFNAGGRPLNSWQVFLLVPFEVGVFAAALAGCLAFLRSCRLPKLHHQLFEVPGFERATQDRFFVLAQSKTDEDSGLALRHLLEEAGAVTVTEVGPPGDRPWKTS